MTIARKMTDLENELQPISKTKLKASADALQDLGVKLLDLPDSKLAVLDLPETLLLAIQEGRKIRANGALRRHRQYIGTLMREIDAQPIIEQFEKWDGKNQAENAFFHGLEKRREQLIADDQALASFIQQYPNVDIQQVRTLIRNARKEAEQNKPPKSSRLLFKLLRDVCGEANPN
jgi:ribosome-associated protein